MLQFSECSFELRIGSSGSGSGLGPCLSGSFITSLLNRSGCSSLFGGSSSHADGADDEQELCPIVVKEFAVSITVVG